MVSGQRSAVSGKRKKARLDGEKNRGNEREKRPGTSSSHLRLLRQALEASRVLFPASSRKQGRRVPPGNVSKTSFFSFRSFFFFVRWVLFGQTTLQNEPDVFFPRAPLSIFSPSFFPLFLFFFFALRLVRFAVFHHGSPRERHDNRLGHPPL